MPELHLKQPGLIIVFVEHLLHIVKEFKNLEKQVKLCFAHNAACSDSKDLAKRTISDKVLKDRAYQIARNHNDDGYQKALASMIDKFLL